MKLVNYLAISTEILNHTYATDFKTCTPTLRNLLTGQNKIFDSKGRVTKKQGIQTIEKALPETGCYRKSFSFFFFGKMPFELNLIPTQTVTGQYISLLVTRKHFFKRDQGRKGRGECKLFSGPTLNPLLKGKLMSLSQTTISKPK